MAAVLPREDPRDVLVLSPMVSAGGLEGLPRGTRVGTSSLRRRAQLLALRPDLEVVELRGNVPTRLRKVDDAQVHAAILAAAGLHRLDAHQHISAYLDAPAWLPAAGQGAIAVQIRSDDARMRELCARMNHVPTWVAVRAERALLAALEGGCQVPIGALAAATEGGQYVLHALISDLGGQHLMRGEAVVDETDPEASGRKLALEMLNRGAWEILGKLRSASHIPSPQPE